MNFFKAVQNLTFLQMLSRLLYCCFQNLCVSELFTALMAVCASSQKDQERLTRCVDLLFRYKADPNSAERHHTTALMFAAKQGHIKVVARLLADPRCKVDAQDSQGWTVSVTMGIYIIKA